MVSVDELLESDEYSDEALIELLERGERAGSLSLLKYLAKGFISGKATAFVPKVSIVERLIDSGAAPHHYGIFVLPDEDLLARLPKPLQSTINIAYFIDDIEIIKVLRRAGEKPNRYTWMYVNANY